MAKILIVASLARSFLNFRREFITALVRNGHEVYLAAPNVRAAEFKDSLDNLGVSGLYDFSLSRAGLNPVADLKSYRSLCKIIGIIRPDVVYAYTIKPVIYSLLAARQKHVPKQYALITGLGYSFQEHSSLKGRLVNWAVRLLYRHALKEAAGVFFQNPDDRDVFIANKIIGFDAKSHVVNGSGVNLQFYAPKLRSKERPLRFLFVGRLLKDKGIREYVAAAELVKKKYPDVIFEVAGSHDANPSAVPLSMYQLWQKEGNVHFLGRVQDIRLALENASVFVLPSYREGTPRSALEAMSMGLPVITTDAPGCRETVVDGENGFLVPVKNVEELARSMSTLVQNPLLVAKMGLRSREIAVERYDVHKVNDGMLKIMGL